MTATGDALKTRLKMLSIPGVLNADRPDAVNSQESIPVDTANVEVPEVSPSGMVGPRGIDTSGRIRVRHIGVPPSQQPGAGQQEYTTRKDRAYPFPIPPQLMRSNPIAPASNSGQVHDGGSAGFPIRGLVVDNYTSIWLYFPGLSIYVPPNTIRFAQPLPASVTKLTVNAEAPPGTTQPALTAGGIFEYTATENEIEYSPGISTAAAAGGGGAITSPIGATTSAASVSVVLATDQAPTPDMNTVEQFADSTTPLAANATFNGTSRDTGNLAGVAGKGWSRFRVFVNADQVGTLNIQQSRDNATWYTTLPQSISVSTPTIVESIITLRYVRVSYTNGATLQGSFELDSALVSV